MKALQKTPILGAVLSVLPVLAHAASAGYYGYSWAQSSQRGRIAAPARCSLAEMNLEPRAYLKRPYAPAVTITPETDKPVTALSRQVAADGPIGSVGLINLSGRGVVQGRSFGDSLASQRGLPSRALGFNVSYNFP
jgi:hypothetical protein